MDDIPSQSSFFSNDPETLGFDLSAGNVWIYPENYPTRDYQFTIVKNSLYRNTLVCLPTGKNFFFKLKMSLKIKLIKLNILKKKLNVLRRN